MKTYPSIFSKITDTLPISTYRTIGSATYFHVNSVHLSTSKFWTSAIIDCSELNPKFLRFSIEYRAFGRYDWREILGRAICVMFPRCTGGFKPPPFFGKVACFRTDRSVCAVDTRVINMIRRLLTWTRKIWSGVILTAGNMGMKVGSGFSSGLGFYS